MNTQNKKQASDTSAITSGSVDEKLWTIDKAHPAYGKVVMMGITGGEAYRWFESDDGTISMIPLSVLNYKPNENKEAEEPKEKR